MKEKIFLLCQLSKKTTSHLPDELRNKFWLKGQRKTNLVDVYIGKMLANSVGRIRFES